MKLTFLQSHLTHSRFHVQTGKKNSKYLSDLQQKPTIKFDSFKNV